MLGYLKSFFTNITYSFTDLMGAIAHPLVDAYSFDGKGIGGITITMATDRTEHLIGNDGATIPIFIPNNSGSLVIECQQNSDMHKWLLGTYNQVMFAAESGMPEEWARMGATLKNLTDNTSHSIRGMSFQKIPDKVYQTIGQNVSWVLLAAEIINESPSGNNNWF